MEQTSSRDEMTVKHQFDRMCKLVLRNALIDHKRQAIVRMIGKTIIPVMQPSQEKTGMKKVKQDRQWIGQASHLQSDIAADLWTSCPQVSVSCSEGRFTTFFR